MTKISLKVPDSFIVFLKGPDSFIESWAPLNMNDNRVHCFIVLLLAFVCHFLLLFTIDDVTLVFETL